MADIDLKLVEIENVFQSLTIQTIGGSPIADVRISWPTLGAPAWQITDDVIFIEITEKDHLYNKAREVAIKTNDASSLVMQTSYTRVISVHWIFYGPNSFDNAQKVRDALFYEYPFRDTLTNNHIYMVPDIPAPNRRPEKFMSQWWERVDMEVLFNELVIKEIIVPSVETIEVVVSDSDNNQIADINIS